MPPDARLATRTARVRAQVPCRRPGRRRDARRGRRSCDPTPPPATAAKDPVATCTIAKLKAAAKKSSSKLECHATAAAHGTAVDPACLAKAEAKFSAAWAQADAKGGCRPSLGEDAVEAKVDAWRRCSPSRTLRRALPESRSSRDLPLEGTVTAAP